MYEAVIVSLELKRVCANGANIQGGIKYTMSKLTCFGLIETHRLMEAADFVRIGPKVCDGLVFQELSKAINDEENARLFEAGANSSFGTPDATDGFEEMPEGELKVV